MLESKFLTPCPQDSCVGDSGSGEEGRLQGRAHRRGELRAEAVRHRGRAGGVQQGGGLPAVDTRYSARHLDTHGNRDLYDT